MDVKLKLSENEEHSNKEPRILNIDNRRNYKETTYTQDGFM